MILSQARAKLQNVVLGWFGLDGSGTYTPGPTMSSQAGQAVSAESALQIAAVWACVRLIAETIASLPCGVYERIPGGGKRPAPGHPLHLILHAQPNTQSTAVQFWEAFVVAMLLPGNAFVEKLMLGQRLVGLRFLSPPRVRVDRMSDGTRRYYYTYDDGIQREIPAARIWRVPGFSLDGDWGVSSIRYGAQVFGHAQAGNEAAGKTFKNGLLPTVAFHYPDKLKDTQREDARAAIETYSGAVNAGKPVILENGMSAETLGINPADAQLLETRRYSREEICAWFRVPPWMVGFGEKSTAWGTGMEQQMIAFQQFVLAPWLRRIEQSIAKDLLSPIDKARYYARFDASALLRGDSTARANFYDKMIKGAVMTPDEAREFEDMEPMGGNASRLIVNSATVLLDSLSEHPVAVQGQGAAAPLPDPNNPDGPSPGDNPNNPNHTGDNPNAGQP